MPDKNETDEKLQDLLTVVVDARNGYREAVEDANRVSMREFFSGMVALKDRHVTELEGLLRARGVEPDESGSFLTTVNKAIFSIRSIFNRLSASIRTGTGWRSRRAAVRSPSNNCTMGPKGYPSSSAALKTATSSLSLRTRVRGFRRKPKSHGERSTRRCCLAQLKNFRSTAKAWRASCGAWRRWRSMIAVISRVPKSCKLRTLTSVVERQR